MKLIFQSFFFSFSVFWRYLFTFPFILIVGYSTVLCLGFLMFLPMILLSFIAPALLFFPPIVLSLVISVFTNFGALIGIRGGLQAKGVYGTPKFISLLGSAFKYSLLQFAFSFFVVAFAVLTIMTIGLYGLEDLSGIGRTIDLEQWWGLLTATPLTTAVFVLTIVAFQVFNAAIMVPIAAAAASGSEKAEEHDFFWGFGANFIPMMVISIIIGIVYYMTDVFLGIMMLALYLTSLMFESVGDRTTQVLETGDLLMSIGFLLFAVWLYCWQYAAATLAYLGRKQRLEEAKVVIRQQPKADPDELRRLRQSRNQQGAPFQH